MVYHFTCVIYKQKKRTIVIRFEVVSVCINVDLVIIVTAANVQSTVQDGFLTAGQQYHKTAASFISQNISLPDLHPAFHCLHASIVKLYFYCTCWLTDEQKRILGISLNLTEHYFTPYPVADCLLTIWEVCY